MNIRQAVTGFLHYISRIRKLSANTVRAYSFDLTRFVTIVGPDTLASSCDRDTLQVHISALFETHGLAASSVKRHVASTRALFRWLEQEGVIREDPFRRAKICIQQPKRLPRVLTRAELRAVLADTEETTFEQVSSRVAAEVLFATGMRVAELTDLSEADVDLDTGVVRIIGKGDRERRVYLNAETITLLRAYARIRADLGMIDDAFLLNSHGSRASTQYVRRLIRRRASNAKIPRRVTPHMFRHSLATYLLEEGVDLRYIQRLLGHRSITTTEIYTYVADASLQALVISRHPRGRLTG